jgi:hypothetical protein
MNELLLASFLAAAPAVSTGYPEANRHGLREQSAVASWQQGAAQRGIQAVGKVVGDAIVDTLELKGMDDPRSWTPATALVGGAYVAAAGLKVEQPVGGWKLALRLLPIRQTGKLTLSRRF